MTDRWNESLSDYLDGELTPEDRREVALHLESCTECAEALRELEQVMERARALPDMAPPNDLWPAIEARLVERKAVAGAAVAEPVAAKPRSAPARPALARKPPHRVVSFTWPQLIAAGLAVALLSFAAFWLGTRGDQRIARGHVSPPATSGEPTRLAARPDAPPTEQAIAELRKALANGREHLDPATVKVLEQNLSTIDRSIREARAALDADPGNPYLRRHLQETMTSKVNLIRQATFLASAP
jgi:hypothetical protein